MIYLSEHHDAVYLATHLVQLLRDGHGDGAAHAAADDTDLFESVQLGRLAERAGKIGERIARLECVELTRRRADDLKDNANRAALRVGAGDRQRNALAVACGAQNNELSRLRFFGDQRRFDLHQGDIAAQRPFFHDFIHKHPPRTAASIHCSVHILSYIQTVFNCFFLWVILQKSLYYCRLIWYNMYRNPLVLYT